MRLERARAVIALTSSAELNQVFASEAAREHGVPETYVAVARDASGASARLAAHHGAHVLFDRAKDVSRWNVRLRHGLALPVRARFAPRPEAAARAAAGGRPDAFVVLAVARGGKAWRAMHAAFAPERGDEAFVLLHREEEDEARAELAALGWEVFDTADDVLRPAAQG
jgi:Trk K+ transport system NAD-binding subunit